MSILNHGIHNHGIHKQYSRSHSRSHRAILIAILSLSVFLMKVDKCASFAPRHVNANNVNKVSNVSVASIFALQCQLLGMNCATPTDFSFSFKGFSLRGGSTDVHCHGWGLLFYQGKGVRCFHDPDPCAESPIAKFVQEHPLSTYNMIAHIRYATVGKVALENVHPFTREMWGIHFSFAHNGDVPLFKLEGNDHGRVSVSGSGNGTNGNSSGNGNSLQEQQLPWVGQIQGERVYNPVGDTDSEKLFCSVLNALRARFRTLPSLPMLHGYLKELLNEIVAYDEEQTILNFIMGCGEHISFAYSWPGQRPGSTVWNALHYVVREPPFQQAALVDCDYQVDFAKLAGDGDRVAVIATKPLTLNENWVEFERNQLILFDEGKPFLESADCITAELAGHGLDSNAIPSSPLLKEDTRRFVLSNRSLFSGADI